MSVDFDILTVLQRHRVPFVVIGGHAVNVHGYRRATDDIDLIWRRDRESEPLLMAALTELEAQYIGNDIDPETGIERTYPVTNAWMQTSHLMMLWTKLGFLDLFDYIPGLPGKDVGPLFDTAITVGGFRFASLDWLRRMKLASGRSKDLLDLDQLPKPQDPPSQP